MFQYTTYGAFQNQMNLYFETHHHGLQFTEMIDLMEEKGLLSDTYSFPEHPENYLFADDDIFDGFVDSLPIYVGRQLNHPLAKEVSEEDIFPYPTDTYTIRHPRHTREYPHEHNYVEINYVSKGTGYFRFEDELHEMQAGELCIIAPGSRHDFIIHDDSIVYSICIRKSTFDTTFFHLISRQDLMAYFFRQILRDNSRSNYLLFFTGENQRIKSFLRNLLLESCKTDKYSNSCCNNYIDLLFSELIRNYSKTIQFYNYEIGSDFSLVLQYIQHNYQTVTLASLAEFFHYSEPHLCTLIKQNTGITFTELLKRLKLRDAEHLLLNTNMKVAEIADRVGYNSADHFSRVFRNTYHTSPLDYRKHHTGAGEFHPFQTEDSEDLF